MECNYNKNVSIKLLLLYQYFHCKQYHCALILLLYSTNIISRRTLISFLDCWKVHKKIKASILGRTNYTACYQCSKDTRDCLAVGLENVRVQQATVRGKATNENKNIRGSFSSYIWRAFRTRTSWSLDTSGFTFVWLDMHRSKTACKIPLFKMSLWSFLQYQQNSQLLPEIRFPKSFSVLVSFYPDC